MKVHGYTVAIIRPDGTAEIPPDCGELRDDPDELDASGWSLATYVEWLNKERTHRYEVVVVLGLGEVQP